MFRINNKISSNTSAVGNIRIIVSYLWYRTVQQDSHITRQKVSHSRPRLWSRTMSCSRPWRARPNCMRLKGIVKVISFSETPMSSRILKKINNILDLWQPPLGVVDECFVTFKPPLGSPHPLRLETLCWSKHYQIQRAVYVLLCRLLPATIPFLVGPSEETEVSNGAGTPLLAWGRNLAPPTSGSRIYVLLLISFPLLFFLSFFSLES